MSETGTNFVGSKISLISKAGIRYLGTLVNINAAESTVALENVISFGTENRPCPTPYPPSKTTYNYIKFRGTDIADLHVFEQSQPQDPAIIEATQGPPSGHHLPGTPMGPPSEMSPGPHANANFNNSFSPNSSSTQRDTSGNFAGYQPQTAPTPANSFSDTGDVPKISSPQPARLPQEGETKGSELIDADDNRGEAGNFRGRGGSNNQRKNSYNRRHREGLPYTNKTLSFDADFDFESANAKFSKTDVIEEFAKKIGKLSLNTNTDPEPATETKADEGEQVDVDDADQCYDKTKSFFDTISCEGLEKERGERRRPPSWQAERSRNSETFGEGNVSYQRRSYQNNYRGRGYNMNGSYGGNNYGGGYQAGTRYSNNNNYSSGRGDSFYRGGYRNSGFRSNEGGHGYNNREGYNRRDYRENSYNRDTNGYNNASRDYNRENWVPNNRDNSERNNYQGHRDNRSRNNYVRRDEGQGRASYRRVERGGRPQTQTEAI